MSEDDGRVPGQFHKVSKEFVDIELHHHGTFTADARNPIYIGGYVDVIKNFNTDFLSYRNLDEFAEKFNYSPECLVHFKNDGKNMFSGMRLLYDDVTIRECVKICEPYGKIELFVDHSFTKDLVVKDKGKKLVVEDTRIDSGDGDQYNDSEDDDFVYEETGSEFSDSTHSFVIESDDELEQNRLKKKQVQDTIKIAMATPFQESDFESDELMSIDSSSEDENRESGYIGPPVVTVKKRRKVVGITSRRSNNLEFNVGMAFVNMEEFRNSVKQYGLDERRGVHFVCNEPDRAHVKCDSGCPFRIWVRRQQQSEIVEIKTLVNEHLCSKPFTNKLASVKYLSHKHGDRIRKNPQWRVKDMIETIRNELEIEVPWIKIMRLRKAALDGVADQLKEHYSRVRDFGYEIIKNNSQNTVKISGTRLNDGDENRFRRIYL
ncbi:uncharacterized protein LOC135151687 [Daucus carota subsp. sativus]|uniref:uncharacterized protein LOC135151687 n=1 Tax=Daucus carota subsp. sativus TaxID=79200 RepID=UPI0030829F32